jgi:hypothetical protein
MTIIQTSLDIIQAVSLTAWHSVVTGIILIRLFFIEKQFNQLKEYQLTNTIASYMLVKRLQEKGILTEEELGIKLDENG